MAPFSPLFSPQEDKTKVVQVSQELWSTKLVDVKTSCYINMGIDVKLKSEFKIMGFNSWFALKPETL